MCKIQAILNFIFMLILFSMGYFKNTTVLGGGGGGGGIIVIIDFSQDLKGK